MHFRRIDVKLMGRKRGMMQFFDDEGRAIPCTVIEIEENVVVQIKTITKDGYSAVQLGNEEIRVKDPRTLSKRVTKPLMGHFRSADVAPRRFLKESRNFDSDIKVGQSVSLSQFAVGDLIDVTAKSKGKGYQGVMKLYNYRGIGSSHGAGPVHRHGGSRGQRSTPGRVFPGNKAAGRMGGRQVSTQNLRIVHIDFEKRAICVKGAVSGSTNAAVTLQFAVKHPKSR